MSENVQLLADENVLPIDEARCNIIDGRTREIKMAEGEDFLGVETDRNSERRYFKCPKIVGDNIDLSFCQMYVGYIGASDKKGEKLREEEPGRYHCDDVFEEGDYIYFSWRLSGNVFKRKGFVAFNIYAVSNAGDEAEIVWNTTLAVGTVKMSIPKGTSALELYPDVINQLFERLLALEAKIGNGGETSFSGSAADVTYDNTNSGLDADNAQKAIDRLSEEKVDQTNFDSHVNNTNIHVTATEKQTWNAKADTEYVDSEITDLKAQGVQQTPLYPEVNDTVENALAWLKTNGDTTKVYVLPDGYIYGYKMTVVEGGATYINRADPTSDEWLTDYRLSSSGPSAQQGKTVCNPIYCISNDVIRVKGTEFEGNVDRVATMAVTGNLYGIQYVSNLPTVDYGYEYVDGVHIFTILSSSPSYVLFSFTTPTDPSSIIITVNEEIVETESSTGYAWDNTNHAFVPNDYDEEFVALNEKISRVKVDVTNLQTENQKMEENVSKLESKIENIGTIEIPDYWQTHLDSKIATIKSLHKQYGKDCFSFIHIADAHYPSNLGKRSPLLAKKIMDETQIKHAISNGDMQTRGCHSTKDSLLAENELILEMFSPILNRILFQKGNHDGAYGTLDRDGDGVLSNVDSSGNVKEVSERETYVYNLTPQEFHEYCYRKVGMVGNVHFDETGSAYYIDDISNNARFIGLNTQCNDYELQDDGTQKYPTMWLMRYTQSQFDFLINEALVDGVTDRTKIIIFGHVPPTQELGDGNLMIAVLKAFKNKTTYNGTYLGTSDNGYDTVSVDCNFTNAKGTLVGYFHGHNHVDSVNSANGFNIIGTRCDAKEENDSTLNAERVSGTITEQSFDVFTVTPSVIYATKIGAGDDREITVI